MAALKIIRDDTHSNSSKSWTILSIEECPRSEDASVLFSHDLPRSTLFSRARAFRPDSSRSQVHMLHVGICFLGDDFDSMRIAAERGACADGWRTLGALQKRALGLQLTWMKVSTMKRRTLDVQMSIRRC